jgi:hypothetical protein
MADTKRHLDLFALTPDDRTVSIAVRVATTDEEGKRVLGPVEQRTWRFAGELSVPTVIRLLRYEQRVNEAIGLPDEAESERACEVILQEAYEEIIGLARALNPIEPDIELELNGQTLLILLGWLAGDVTVADAVIAAITAGKSAEELAASLKKEGLAEDGSESTGGGAELGSGPLPLKTPS